MSTLQHLSRPAIDGGTTDEQVAYVKRAKPDAQVCFVFCGGFRSDMEGSKALEVEQTAHRLGQNSVRFDYFGHGVSTGDFTDGYIGRWKDDTLAVIDALTDDLPIILVGSSMGGWIGLLASLARPDRVKAFVGLAAAPDFTRKLMWANATTEQQDYLMANDRIEQPNDYSDEPYVITKKLIVEGDEHLLLDGPIALDIPVRLIHGLKDTDVPKWVADKTLEMVTAKDATLTLVKEGDHRLSEPTDLMRLNAMLTELFIDLV